MIVRFIPTAALALTCAFAIPPIVDKWRAPTPSPRPSPITPLEAGAETTLALTMIGTIPNAISGAEMIFASCAAAEKSMQAFYQNALSWRRGKSAYWDESARVWIVKIDNQKTLFSCEKRNPYVDDVIDAFEPKARPDEAAK